MWYQAEVRKVEEQEGHRMELDGTESTCWLVWLEFLSRIEISVDQFIRMMRRLPYESHEFIEFRERVEVLKHNCREGANTSALNLTKPLRANVPARKWCTTKSSLESSCVFHLLGLLVLRLHHAMMYDINGTVPYCTLLNFANIPNQHLSTPALHPCPLARSDMPRSRRDDVAARKRTGKAPNVATRQKFNVVVG